MIHKVQRGAKTFLEATFGTGDIRIMTAGEHEDNYLSMVILSQHFNKPESEWNATPCSIKNTDELKGEDTIFLKFNKVKSIDMLIESLQEVRESMLSKDSIVGCHCGVKDFKNCICLDAKQIGYKD